MIPSNSTLARPLTLWRTTLNNMYWFVVNIEITFFEQKMKTDKPSGKENNNKHI
jgi:hypothetical protein